MNKLTVIVSWKGSKGYLCIVSNNCELFNDWYFITYEYEQIKQCH